MACKETVLAKLSSMERGEDERSALLLAMMESSKKEGADGVAVELVERLDNIRARFNAALQELEGML